MRTESCENGHYYNLDKYSTCPYCDESKPMFYQHIDDGNDATQILDRTRTKELKTAPIDNETTQMLDVKKSDVVELAGWLVIISSEGKSQSYDITYGMNRIGRAETNEIVIRNDDVSISREKHASIIYDFENNLFFIQHHEGKYLTYLNGKMVHDLTDLKAFDKIKIGKTEFIFVPLCGESFKWEDYEN